MLTTDLQDAVLILRLDNPRRLNAWSHAMREDLREALDQAGRDTAVKAAVITGSGERAFCAGADLTDPSMGDPSAAQARMDAFRALYLAIMSFPKPLVAALNGLTLGSAFQAVMLMDHRVAHPGVRLGLPEINSGMPCITGTAILSWTLGPQLARSLALGGRFIEGDEALRLGLVEDLTAREHVFERALETARDLAAKSPEAYAETKHWVRDLCLPDLDAAFARAALSRGKANVAQSVRRGIGDFLAARGSCDR